MVAGSDPLRLQMVGQTIGPSVHFGERASLTLVDDVLPIGPFVDRGLEEIGKVESGRPHGTILADDRR